MIALDQQRDESENGDMYQSDTFYDGNGYGSGESSDALGDGFGCHITEWRFLIPNAEVSL